MRPLTERPLPGQRPPARLLLLGPLAIALAPAIARADAEPTPPEALAISAAITRAALAVLPAVEPPAEGEAARRGIPLSEGVRTAARAAVSLLGGAVERAATSFQVPDLSVLRAEPVRGVANSGFGWRDDPIHHYRKFHRGTDYRADRGTPVYAAADGRVSFAGRQHGYGRVIELDHGGGLRTRYAHLNRIEVKHGQLLPANVEIGQVGSTGRTTGPHLHFEVRIAGKAVDPNVAVRVGMMQRSEAPEVVRIAALALHPAVQEEAVSEFDPPRSPKADVEKPRAKAASRSRDRGHKRHHRARIS